jgi:NADH-quinone oxidoreductase subunit L
MARTAMTITPWPHRYAALSASSARGAGSVVPLAWHDFLRDARRAMEAPFVQSYFSWMPVGALQIDAALQLDQLSMVIVLVITGVGALIHIFSVGYMREDPGYPRYFAYLNLFVFFMLVLVLGANFPVLFVGWKASALLVPADWLLVLGQGQRPTPARKHSSSIESATSDFSSRCSSCSRRWDLWTFAGVFGAASSLSLWRRGSPPAYCLFLFLGCVGKSAQIPLYIWLPDAMAGPTPVSALIHAATMVTAGVYLVARSSRCSRWRRSRVWSSR